jgi:hypothetical protein
MPQKKINAYRKRKSFSVGQGDSGEQCGPWASMFFVEEDGFFKDINKNFC